MFQSFFWGGFECSSHRRADGLRLDMLASTNHSALARHDYMILKNHGIGTVRDGVRWHLIEQRPGVYDWSSLTPMLIAAREAGTQVVWDLCHYGLPDDLDIWSADFVTRFAAFAGATAKKVAAESSLTPIYCSLNEISFWAWAGGEVGRINPATVNRGADLKRQLVRAAIAAMDAVRAVDPTARFITAEPLIHVTTGAQSAKSKRDAESYRLSQFEATDMLAGLLDPELGGGDRYLDIIGVNYYPENQWYAGGPPITLGHHAYRPLAEMLREVYQRYRRPLVISETGAEGSACASWLHYVCSEVRIAQAAGVEIDGVCLYPVLDYPGWDNGRLCQVGLLTGDGVKTPRTVRDRIATELQSQHRIFAASTSEEVA